MKVPDHDPTKPIPPPPAPGQFQRVLQQTRPRAPLPPGVQPPPGPAVARSPAVTPSRAALASPEGLGQARQAMHGEAHRLRSVRTEAQTMAQEKTEHRLCELISRELTRQLPVEPPSPCVPRAAAVPPEPPPGPVTTEGFPHLGEQRLSASVASMTPQQSADPQLKLQAAVELIEKIEVFIRSQRPALRMSLGWPMAAMVEVERTGPREVALRIQGHLGPLAQEDLSRIREELGSRGLRLRSLHAE